MGQAQDSKWYDAEFKRDKNYAVKFQSSRYYELWKIVLKTLKKWAAKKLIKILELGAGTGQFAAMLEDAGFTDYVGIDFSEVAVAMANDATKLRIVCKSIESADLETDQNYNVVVILETLEHLKDDTAVLERIRSGVRVIFTVPDFDGGSHERFFKTVAAVKKRYGKYFVNLEVAEVGHYYIGEGKIK